MIKKKNAAIAAIAALTFSCSGGEEANEAREPLNVLFIPVDDLRYQANVFGQEEMITPNLDQLAKDGVAFNRAYCNVPVCGASRASLMSGVRPTPDRFVNFYASKDEDFPHKPSIAKWFKDHGYTTVSMGKVYHHQHDDLDAWSKEPWDHQAQIGIGWQSYITEESRIIIEGNRTEEHPNRVIGPAWEAADVPDNGYPDGLLAERAIEQLKVFAETGEPFFLGVGFTKPHLPFNAPQKYWDMYDVDDLVLADNPFKPLNAPDAAMHEWGELRGMYHGIPQEGPVCKETEINLVHGYYACVTYIDFQVGKLMQALEETGLADNTIVILWGDHGFHLGEHGLWAKHCNFDRVLAAPLIVKSPDIEGHITETLVEFIDIYPSLVELAGLPMPDHLDGKSFVPSMKDPEVEHKEAIFSRYINGESVKTDQFLYTEWVNEDGYIYARMLYDNHNDPAENVNISEEPEYADVVEKHHIMLQELRESLP